MLKSTSNIFVFLKSCVHFLKIVTMFFIMLHLLYWIQHLTGSNWAWMNFAHPILDWYINLGTKISDGTAEILGTVFEYKYIAAMGLYIVTYFLMNLLNLIINEMEYIIKDIIKGFTRHQENCFNKDLLKEQTIQETKINQYKVLVKTSIKKQFSYANFGYNLEEQNRMMNKFLIEKIGTQPEFFEDGFLYSFSDFSKIDTILEIFFRLLKSEAPLDYIICVQVFDGNCDSCLNKLKLLADLKMFNKITMLSETSYRYSFNGIRKYNCAQCGIYQKENTSLEVSEFLAD